MYYGRIKRKSKERTFYLVTNRIDDGKGVLRDVEKERLQKFIFSGQRRYGHTVWGCRVREAHYHVLIEIPAVSSMSREQVLRKWYKHQRSESPEDPGNNVLGAFRRRIHDLNIIVSDFQQRFTRWYNPRKNRWGRLFGRGFEKVILNQNDGIAKAMAYVGMKPIRTGLVEDPSKFPWSGGVEVIARSYRRTSDSNLVRSILN